MTLISLSTDLTSCSSRCARLMFALAISAGSQDSRRRCRDEDRSMAGRLQSAAATRLARSSDAERVRAATSETTERKSRGFLASAVSYRGQRHRRTLMTRLGRIGPVVVHPIAQNQDSPTASLISHCQCFTGLVSSRVACSDRDDVRSRLQSDRAGTPTGRA